MMSDPYFIAVSVITVASAIIALEFRELIYGAIALAITLLGIAMFFVLLDATFVAMFQITVYVGAVVVLIIFTIMLVRREAWLKLDEGGRRRVMGAVIALAVIGLVGALLAGSSIARWQASENTPTLIQIGEEMLTYYSPAFIALAFTLAASVIGALVLAKVERGKEREMENEKEGGVEGTEGAGSEKGRGAEMEEGGR
ncbi:MAG: NADH-quinone oxidoreductase subunit J [Candidatus Nitrosocaldus sp.]